MTLTQEERRTLRHMLGLDHTQEVYRNHYAVNCDHALMRELEVQGLVWWQVLTHNQRGGIWRVTREAAQLVLEDGESLGAGYLYRETYQEVVR